MLSVSRAVARGGPLTGVLDHIAGEAARVVDARSASVLLLRGRRFKLTGSYGLSPGYSRMLEAVPRTLSPGHGPAGLAVEEGVPAIFEDCAVDPRFAPWRELAANEGYQALTSVPLRAVGSILGTLTVYRAEPGPWPDAQVDLLVFFGDHAANAIHTARLIDRQGRQLGALHRMVRGLRAQAHEHANRLHALGGLLAMGDADEARRFIADLGPAYELLYDSIEDRIQPASLAGLIVAESNIARQRGIELDLNQRSRLERLPSTLEDAEAITIVGNLLDNAMDAVADLPKRERHVELRIHDRKDELEVRVSNRGPRIPDERRAAMFRPGYTTKEDHAGLGLALVSAAVASAFGQVAVQEDANGTNVVVRIPHA
jgi:signal transduction histidine kinase